jgi:hypothetical protein
VAAWQCGRVHARSKASVCSRLIAGMAGSNPAEGMDVLLLSLLCVVLGATLLRAGDSLEKFCRVCVCVCVCVCV